MGLLGFLKRLVGQRCPSCNENITVVKPGKGRAVTVRSRSGLGLAVVCLGCDAAYHQVHCPDRCACGRKEWDIWPCK